MDTAFQRGSPGQRCDADLAMPARPCFVGLLHIHGGSAEHGLGRVARIASTSFQDVVDMCFEWSRQGFRLRCDAWVLFEHFDQHDQSGSQWRRAAGFSSFFQKDLKLRSYMQHSMQGECFENVMGHQKLALENSSENEHLQSTRF